MKSFHKLLEKSPLAKGFFLFFPFIPAFLAIICLVVLLFRLLIEPSVYFRFLTDNAGSTVSENLAQSQEGERPVIFYEQEWATLNVEGWERKDIKVFFGDNNAILRKGAGMSSFSRFCGENGKIILSGHVTKYFYEIEDTKIGDLVTMDTIYGKYVYKVTGTTIFQYTDSSLLIPKDGEEVLIMYTCYPRKNGYLFKNERLALICKKVEGKEWKNGG